MPVWFQTLRQLLVPLGPGPVPGVRRATAVYLAKQEVLTGRWPGNAMLMGTDAATIVEGKSDLGERRTKGRNRYRVLELRHGKTSDIKIGCKYVETEWVSVSPASLPFTVISCCAGSYDRAWFCLLFFIRHAS